MNEKLKKFINAHSGVDVIKDILDVSVKDLDYIVKCELKNGRIKSCLVNIKTFESLKDSVKWIHNYEKTGIF